MRTENSAISNEAAHYSTILAKFRQYKEKIMNDANIERELNLFWEVHASAANDNSTCYEMFELSLDIQKNFLENICHNKTWKDLTFLLLEGNLLIMEAKDVCKVIEDIVSKKL